nr:maestro heat-like repeat-containing protein family member 7 [Pogona vitticeps]
MHLEMNGTEPSSGKLASAANLEKATSSVSSPRHADSPTSVSSFSSSDSEADVKDVLGFMRKFLGENCQDISEKLKFLDCVDIINTTFDGEKKEGFGDHHGNQSLLRDTLKFLLSETASLETQEREGALARITKLIHCITSHCITKGMKDFKTGQVAGYLTLCCGDPSEKVCQWAAEGLHHLYTLVLHQKRLNKAEDNQAYLEPLQEWEEEKIFWLAWFSDVSTTTRVTLSQSGRLGLVFKKCLRVDDQMDFMLIAIKAMREDDMHSTKAACLMLKAMLRNPTPSFVKVSKAVKFMYYSLEHISCPPARQIVFHFLHLLGSGHPQEVVEALLRCSLQCDSSASSMWHVLTSFTSPAQKVLDVLQATLQERPLHPASPGFKPNMDPLAATAALYEILRNPSPACKDVLKAMYPTLSIALLCHISYTVNFTPQEIDHFWRSCIQQKLPTPLSPFRSALRTFRALVRRASDGDQSLIMNKRRGSELLCHHATHQKGLTLFARALLRNEGCEQILPYLIATLDAKEDMIHLITMIFIVEILDRDMLDECTEDLIIQHLCTQLKSSRTQFRTLSLNGMLRLTPYPKKVAKLKPAVLDLLARLKEANREINVKALKVLEPLLKTLDSKELKLYSVEVATRVIPLFDDASNKVRLAAVATFVGLLDVTRRGSRDLMKQFTMQSLVPLMLHLQDESVPVAQACWTALRKADQFLKSFIQLSIHVNDPWNLCTSLVTRYREQGEGILLEQAFGYLENPRRSLRDGAIRLLEIIAQASKHKDTVTAITTVLNLVQLDAKPSDIYLVASEIIETIERDSSGNFVGRCFDRIRTMCRR